MKCANPARGSGRRFLFVGSTNYIEQNILRVQCVERQVVGFNGNESCVDNTKAVVLL